MAITKEMKDFLRGNPKLKAPGYKEYVSQDMILERMNEMKRIIDDPIYFAEKYFYIITTDGGKQIIKVYPKQAEMINAMCGKQRCITLACRQCGKSTSYTVFCLWYCIINKDKNILICANKFGTAKDILSRIKQAYEDLPLWLKPGIVEWNRASIVFDNGCRISAEATSGSSGRGSSINVLICDEFAFLKPGIEDEFLQSVFPVVSSSKTSKIIIVSTPHGMGNEFYRIWNRASLDLDEDEVETQFRWFPVKVDWFEVPGRDDAWYKQQLESFGGSHKKFDQEYGCSFLGSAETLINSDLIKKYKDEFADKRLKGTEVKLHPDFDETKIKIYHLPEKNHAYVIGADPSMGLGADFQSMIVWDITNTFQIKQVASFYENSVQPKIFAYILAKTGLMYNNAFVAIENNGCSQVALDALWRDFDYDSIVHEGGNERTNIGIHSMNARKAAACLNFKLILEDKMRSVEINDGRLIAEMEKFERVSRMGKLPTYEAVDGHDDYMMSAVWGLYVLKFEIVERYYDIKKAVRNKLGEEIPLFVLPFQEESSDIERKRNIFELDQKFDTFTNDQEKYLNKIKKEADTTDIDNFIKSNNLEAYDPYEIKEDDNNKNKRNPDDENFQFRYILIKKLLYFNKNKEYYEIYRCAF